MIGESGTAAGVCVIAAIFATLLKQYQHEHTMFCVIAACVAVGAAAIAYLSPIADSVNALFAQTEPLPKS